MAGNDLVRIGRIAEAHGLRGEVRVRCFTENPEDVGAYGPVRDGQGRSFTLSGIRPAKGPFVVARLEGVCDRNAAEAIAGRDLFVPRDRLPPPEDDEWYYDDLLGLAAVDVGGAPLGKVIAVHDFGAGDILEIAPEQGPAFMVPFTAQCVPDINMEARIITIIPLRDDES